MNSSFLFSDSFLFVVLVQTNDGTSWVEQPGLIGNYHPQCEEDGTYSRVQCHGGMGYCWCVDENGVKNDKSIDNC
ncbi:hypothetical protein NPIL_677161 [Nephila pilipes]|uniref:Thyroglobulin type-1 domain-containing protein n=1 Tax=Nephila pilipes TaxID=299642 RepID=A0A8X6NNK7_NEPPI|nr:hypothetical protein NPIL_677161 [Nephila pilipes]